MDISLPALNLGGIGPQLVVVGTGMLIMLADAVGGRSRKRWLGYLALAGLVAALAWIVGQGMVMRPVLDGALAADGLSAGFSLVLIGAAMLSILVALDYLRREGLEHGEYYALILFATAGGLAMAAAADLIVVFIGLEALSISLYVLCGFAKSDAASREAAESDGSLDSIVNAQEAENDWWLP